MTHNYMYDLDVRGLLQSITRDMSAATGVYHINIPVAGGFVYGRQGLSGRNSYSLREPYRETGRYYGTLQPGNNVEVQVITAQGCSPGRQPLSAVNAGTRLMKPWISGYLGSLL